MNILMATCMFASLAAASLGVFSSVAATPAWAATSARDCTGDDCQQKRSTTEQGCRRKTPVS